MKINLKRLFSWFRKKDEEIAPEPESGSTLEPPNAIRELETYFWDKDVPCTCDLCQPKLYGRSNCSTRFHKIFSLRHSLDTNKYGYIVFQPPPLRASAEQPPELMHLARTLIEYFDRPWEYMNDRQLAAREGLLKWVDGRADLFKYTTNFDAEKAIPASEMRYLWKMISEMFFGVDIGDGTFTWDGNMCDLGTQKTRFKETTNQPSSMISMNSADMLGDFGKFNTLSIVSILFHEAIHAVLEEYGCPECKTSEINDMAGHHGRPYQMLSTKIEEVVPILLGIPVKIGKFDALVLSWDEVHNLISRHDLAVFKLSSTKLLSWEKLDVAELASRTKALCDFKPHAWMEARYWPAYWVDQHGNYNKIPDELFLQTTNEEENNAPGADEDGG